VRTKSSRSAAARAVSQIVPRSLRPRAEAAIAEPPSVAPEDRGETKSHRLRLLKNINWRGNRASLVAVILVIAVVAGVKSPTFLTWTNWQNILQQVSPTAILAFGMTLLMVSGGIDLSVGSGVSLTGVVVAELLVHDFPLLAAIILAISLAAGVGLVNGLLAAHSRAHPFILTLGMLTLLQGITLIISSQPVYGLPEGYLNFTFQTILGIPIFAVFALGVGVTCQFLLKQTVYGRHLYALGGSEEAALLAGVRIKTTKVLAYIFMGLLVGITAVLLTSLLSAGQANEGQGMELTAIAAVAVGGTPLSGGRGDIVGTTLGVLLLGMITNSLNLLSINSYVQDILIGLIIIVAVMAQRQRQ
jgi:ribose transport system permease protein